MDRKTEANKHNFKLVKEYTTPEDVDGGMDVIYNDPRNVNLKKMRRDLKNDIK